MFKSKYFKIPFALLACLLCTEVLAATVFSVAPTDRSKIYLGMVFGGNVGSIQLSGDANTTLALMFARFNYIILTVGVLVISYIGVSSTINTAREGEAMGKKMSAWVPMRAFLGTLLMVPGPTSGYSVVQMTVIWIVLNGIGAANSVWNVILNQLSRNISVVAKTSARLTDSASAANATMDQELGILVHNVMMASTCMHSINNMTELSAIPGNMQQYGPVRVFVTPGSATPTTTAKNASGNPTRLTLSATINVGLNTPSPSAYSTLCGSFAITSTLDKTNNPYDTFNSATLNQRLAIKIAALQSMFGVVDPAATLIAQTPLSASADLDPRFYAPPDPGYYLLAKQAYLGQTAQLSQGIQISPDPSNSQAWEEGMNDSDLQDGTRLKGNKMAQIQSYGWIHAGSYYYDLVKATKKRINDDYMDVPLASNVPTETNLDAKNMPLGTGWNTVTGTSLNTALNNLINGDPPKYQTKKLNAYLNRMEAYYAVDIQNSTISSEGIGMSKAKSTGNKVIDMVINAVVRPIQNAIMRDFEKRVAGNGEDPLASLHEFGWGMMVSAEAMGIYGIVLCMTLSMALSSGSCLSPFAWSTQTAILQLTPLVFGMAAMLWTGGATLNIYLPMVPYLIFTTAAFGWMIAVIEAVVGAPIVALALAHPSGDDLGKVGQPLILLANVFLRPMLMLFGFILGAGLLRAGIAMINFGFLPAINAGTSPTIFSIIAILMMYIFLVMAIVNKSFSLIYLLPNQIMRWIGGPTETSDPSDMVKEAKGGFDTGAKAGQGALNEGLSQSKASVSESLKNAKKKGAKGGLPQAAPPGGGGAPP